MSDGLGYGDNTKATLMTRGLAEMTRLGRVLGANPMTYMGLAGMGDLIVTCTTRHSRNRGLGELIARGGTMQEFYDKTHMVAEGAVACLSVGALGTREGVDLPITQMVKEVLYDGLDPKKAGELLYGHYATLRWQHGDTRLPEVLVSGEGLRRTPAEVLGPALRLQC